jgi:hypothetical protein
MSHFHHIVSLAVAVAGCLSARPACAQEHAGQVVLGLRTGYAVPFGAIEHGSALSDAFDGHVPVWLDVGVKLSPSVVLGAYGVYGYGIISRDDTGRHGCPSGLDCAGHLFRFGPQLQVQLAPGQGVDPWLGVGVGYEVVSVSIRGTVNWFGSPTQLDASASDHGFEFLNLQAGVDFAAARQVGIGPFASWSLGEYTGCSEENAGRDIECRIDYPRLHEWLTLGLRGAFEL